MPRATSHSPARRLFLLKIFAYLDYAFSVVGNAYLGMYMATIALRLDQIFLVSVISVVIAIASQNLLSRLSDRRHDRMTFMILSRIFSAASISIVAFVPTLAAVIVSVIFVNLISGEMVSAAVVYELVDQHINTLPPDKALAVNKSKEFAKYRLFGSIGWAWTAPFGGIAISTLNGVGGNP
nr:MFS transporter [Candidatus Sigynarchaeota archaeon]